MKKILVSMMFMSFLAFTTLATAQMKNTSSKEKGNTLVWTTKSEAAKKKGIAAVKHLMNIETPLAYQDFKAALELDPDFTIALVFMANLNKGATRDVYIQMAQKSAVNKTEGEKLLITLLDEKGTSETRRDTWAKLNKMFPGESMVGHFYVITRATPEESFNAAIEYIEKFPTNANMHNIIAYMYLIDKKDNEMAKKHFEKYIELYPDGCNPYDSMGEFYLTAGNTKKAEEYYKKAIEKYPFFISAVNALDKIDKEKEKDNATEKDKKAERN